jgi:hypothetical protein
MMPFYTTELIARSLLTKKKLFKINKNLLNYRYLTCLTKDHLPICGKNALRKLGNPTFKKTSLGRRLFRHLSQFQIETTNKLTLNND